MADSVFRERWCRLEQAPAVTLMIVCVGGIGGIAWIWRRYGGPDVNLSRLRRGPTRREPWFDA